METSAADTSPSPSAQGFKTVLAKTRRSGKDVNSSTPSVNSTINSSEGHGIRSSIDSTGDKLQGTRRSSTDDGLASPKTRKLSKLIPKRLLKKAGNHRGREIEEPSREVEEVGEGDRQSRNVAGSQSTLGFGSETES